MGVNDQIRGLLRQFAERGAYEVDLFPQCCCIGTLSTREAIVCATVSASGGLSVSPAPQRASTPNSDIGYRSDRLWL
jgi:hypothetical protein